MDTINQLIMNHRTDLAMVALAGSVPVVKALPRPVLALTAGEFLASALKTMSFHLQTAGHNIPELVPAAGRVVHSLHAGNNALLRRICLQTAMTPATAAVFGRFLAALALIHACAGCSSLNEAVEKTLAGNYFTIGRELFLHVDAFWSNISGEANAAESMVAGLSSGRPGAGAGRVS